MDNELMSDEFSCARCGRKLTTALSAERGYGPVCYKKHLKAQEEQEQMELEELEGEE